MSKKVKTPGPANGAIPHMSPADLAALEHASNAHEQSSQSQTEPTLNAPEIVEAATDTQPISETKAEGAQAAAPGQPPPTVDSELASAREQLLRMGADFENFRKRTRQEQQEERRRNVQGVLHVMLPVIDNLERALMHAPQNSVDPVIEGVRMVAKQFHDVFGNYGVRAFKSQGGRFDPERHEAVGEQTSPTDAPGTILTEHQSGYMMHERLLRAARVIVADQASGTELS